MFYRIVKGIVVTGKTQIEVARKTREMREGKTEKNTWWPSDIVKPR